MTGEEFDEWLDFHQGVFPEVADWMTERDQAQTLDLILREWRVALRLVYLDDAMECSRRMLAGIVQHPNRFEISRLPAVVVQNTPYRLAPIGA